MTLEEYIENARRGASSLMNLHPLIGTGKKLANSVANKFNSWQDNEKELYVNYKQSQDYDPVTNTFTPNPNYHSSAFGEAKGANLINAPFLGPTPFQGSENPMLNSLDYGVGAAQLAAGNAINGAYQLGQEGYKTVRDNGWKSLISTDWLNNAKKDFVEEGNAFNKARFAESPPTTPQNLWDFGNSVDDANVVPAAQGGLGPNGGRAQAASQVTAPVLPAPVKSTPVRTVSPGGGNSRRTYSKPAATAPSVSRPRARATRGRSAPIIRQSRNGPPQNRFR
jgi:hypothetical protein